MALFLLGLCHSFLRLDVKSISSRPKSKNNEQTILQGKSESSCQQNARCSKTNSWVSLEQWHSVESGVPTWREGWSRVSTSSLRRCLDSKEFLPSSSWLLFREHPTLSKLHLSRQWAYWIMVLLYPPSHPEKHTSIRCIVKVVHGMTLVKRFSGPTL